MEQPEQISLNSLLTPENTHANVACSSKKRALEMISQIGEATVGVPAQTIFEALLNRERLGCTYIGAGVAMPHCQLDDDFKTFMIVLQLQHPIDFDCIDDNPIDLIFAFVFPQDNHAQHCQLLQSLLNKLSDKTLIKALKNAETDQALYALLSAE